MKIKLQQKKLKNGKSSLYLEFYNGYQKDENGVISHRRTFEYLQLYLFENPQNSDEERIRKLYRWQKIFLPFARRIL